MGSDYPLGTLKVVALEQAVAAPLASRHLADLGADVIKLEKVQSGDFARHYDGAVHGVSSYFAWLNRSKRSLTLDFKRPEGRTILEKLLDQADVFLTNLSPAALERSNLGPDHVISGRDMLIYCSISGYGRGGPYESRKAYDLLLQGESGIISTTGLPEQPAKVGVSVCDISSGIYALTSILAALIKRQQTSQGSVIDISMLEASTEWIGAQLNYFLNKGNDLQRAGMRHNLIVPYGPYRCQDGKYLNLAVQNKGEWQRFCAMVLEQPQLAEDPRFRSNERRLANRETLEALIENVFSGLDRESLIKRLTEADVPWGNVNEMEGVAQHPQLRARRRWGKVSVEGKLINTLEHPMNISGMPQRFDPVPTIGEHSEQVLRELGYTSEKIAEYRAQRII